VTNVPLPSAIGAESAPLQGIDEVDCNTTLTCVILEFQREFLKMVLMKPS